MAAAKVLTSQLTSVKERVQTVTKVCAGPSEPVSGEGGDDVPHGTETLPQGAAILFFFL